MKDGKVYIWMNLVGYEKNDPDRGVQRYLDQIGFIPDGIGALLFHPDFFHQHRGMEEEYILPPDNCMYYGAPCNPERQRQEWTNYDLRTLTQGLAERGIPVYASIMGNILHNAFHEEWYNEHPEVLRHGHQGEENPIDHYFFLKRFKDGTWYEDFFIDKVCQTLTDYGMQGIHFADNAMPGCVSLTDNLDFSTDFVGQFLDHTGLTLPPEVAATMGCDSQEAETIRSKWIYRYQREAWIRFSAWRWEAFFKKLCDRVHAIGKEVTALAMYCTDPFETLYCTGADLSGLIRAGVDWITANILPAGVYVTSEDRPNRFSRYMALASTTAAHIGRGKLVSMLGVHDASEEWSMMHHAPCLHERDMYSMMAYQLIDKDGICRALDGYFLCLGDGISRTEWDWERERLEAALSVDAEACLSPAMLWSDYAFQGMLTEYINTRRWTPHKLFYQLGDHGAHLGAAVTSDGLCNYSGPLVVPNFDMLSPQEQQAVANYDRGAVLCTAKPGFDPASVGIQPEILFRDGFSNYPLTAFAFGCQVSDALREEIAALLAEDDGTPNLEGDLMELEEPTYVLTETLHFTKVTEGFQMAMAKLLLAINQLPFQVNKPHLVVKTRDGAYRLYIFNDHISRYRQAFVQAQQEIREVKTITKFPILPPRFMNEASGKLTHIYNYTGPKKAFEMKLQPGGVTVVDIYF